MDAGQRRRKTPGDRRNQMGQGKPVAFEPNLCIMGVKGGASISETLKNERVTNVVTNGNDGEWTDVYDCDELLCEVMEEARRLGIPFSSEIESRVGINRRAATRFGCCKFQNGRFYIEVAETVAQGPEKSCREVLAHELLHTCPGCRNHGAKWKSYAARMNRAYGYEIQRVTTNASLGVQGIREPKYVLRCERCGVEIPRFRASALTRHPERYRCRCGGTLALRIGPEDS